MKFEYAKNLHNGDEVTVKDTKEIVRVHTTVVERKLASTPMVFVNVFTKDGWRKLSHLEIE